jgi:DNA helicase-2/ATP-dependent DNA helicase PcrA
MYRTNAQSRAIEEALMGRGLPYHVVGGTRFYERKEVKDLLAYLRLIANPFDSVSLERIINTPKRGIGTRTVGELNRLAATLECPVYQALRAVEQGTPGAAGVFAARTRKPLLAFLGLIDQFIEAHAEADLLALFDLIVAQLEFREFLLGDYGTDEGEERWANVLELRKVAAEYAGLPREAQLPTFLEEVALVADVDTMDRQGNAVTCITLHQAKGLEYAAVFLVGLEEGLLPHSRSTDDRDKLEEERRLFYVGATRARERLYLLYAFRRNMFGRENFGGNLTTRSRFLKDIQAAAPDMIRQVGKRATTTTPPLPRPSPAERGRARPRMESLLDTGAEGTRFFPGQRVSHHMYGEGVVVSSRLVESDEEVRVNFGAQGEKVLLASFANLQHADAD